MKTFKIPVEWSSYGTVEVEAETLKDALKMFHEHEDEFELPKDEDYMDGSFKASYSDDEMEDYFGKEWEEKEAVHQETLKNLEKGYA
jgi:hypothetical protein